VVYVVYINTSWGPRRAHSAHPQPSINRPYMMSAVGHTEGMASECAHTLSWLPLIPPWEPPMRHALLLIITDHGLPPHLLRPSYSQHVHDRQSEDTSSPSASSSHHVDCLYPV
jgi:hypothetical protein